MPAAPQPLPERSNPEGVVPATEHTQIVERSTPLPAQRLGDTIVHVHHRDSPQTHVHTELHEHEHNQHHHHHEQRHVHPVVERVERTSHSRTTERVAVRTTPRAPAPAPQRAPVGAMETPRAAEARPPRDAPAPVHIAIGRIVVAPAASPPTPQPRAAQAAPAKSLAEILASKKGRA
ncbi:MAG: hypothetical protein ACE37F_19430 [Nannocystaceae bacterium]|nr:hypothetical protein [bacterium]